MTNGDQCAEYSQALYEKGKEVARDGLDRISKDPKTPDGDGKGSGGSGRGGKEPPNLGNLKRVPDRELKRRVGDVHKYKSEALDTKKNLSDWDVYRDGQRYFLKNKKTGAIVEGH